FRWPVPTVPPWAAHVEPPPLLLPPEARHGRLARPHDPRTPTPPLRSHHAEGLSGGRHRPHQTFRHRPRPTQRPPGAGLPALPHERAPPAVDRRHHHRRGPPLLLPPGPAPPGRPLRAAGPAHPPPAARNSQRHRTRSPLRRGRQPAALRPAHD